MSSKKSRKQNKHRTIKGSYEHLRPYLQLGVVRLLRRRWHRLGVIMETIFESMCVDCGWKGSESEHHFLDGWHVCPKCHQPDFLVTGEEVDEMGEREAL